jgi:hypothetical protein
MFFLLGVKGGLLFLITKKEKSPLKTSLFHLVFTDVNTSFVCVANSPLFSEQQKRFRAGLPAKGTLNPSGFIKKYLF